MDRPGPSALAAPFPPIDGGRLGMLIFLGTETMLFAGFIAAFLIFRMGAVAWPPPSQPRLPVLLTAAYTLALLASGLAVRGAAGAARRETEAARRADAARGRRERSECIRFLVLAGSLGAVFLVAQGSEWVRLLEFGLTASSGTYGATFYTLVGAHGAHVLGALLWLGFVLVRAVRRPLAPIARDVSLMGMFWWFVVGLWPVLYVLVYLA